MKGQSNRRPSFIFLMLVLFLLPLPFGSARPLWVWLLVVIMGILGFVLFCRSHRDKVRPLLTKKLWIPLALALSTMLISGSIDELVVKSVINASKMSYSSPTSNEAYHGLSFLHGEFSATSHKMQIWLHVTFFVIVCLLVRSQRDLENAINFVSIVVSLYCTWALITYFSGNTKILWYDKWANRDSLTGTFVNRNHFASYAGIGFQCIVWQIGLLLCIEENSNRNWSHNIRKLARLATMLALTGTALVLTNSRGGITATAFGTFILVAILSHRNGYRLTNLIYAAVITLGLFLPVLYLSGDVVVGRFTLDVKSDPRMQVYSLMAGLVDSHFWRGLGLFEFGDIFRLYRTENQIILMNKGHSDVMEFFLKVGVPAATLFFSALLVVLLTIIIQARNCQKRTIYVSIGLTIFAQIGLHSSVDFPTQIPAISFTAVFIVAACFSYCISLTKEPIGNHAQ